MKKMKMNLREELVSHDLKEHQNSPSLLAAPVTCTADAPSDLSQSPVDEHLWRYPATKVGQQDHYFNRRWYEDYK